MSPSTRKREYEKRRYEKWVSKHEQRLAAQRRRRNVLAAAGSVLAVLLVVGGTVWIAGRDDDPAADASANAAASPSPSASASASPSASAKEDSKNPCPAPDVKAPAKPKSWDEVPDKALAEGKTWKLSIETTCGPITVELDGAKAPQAVASTIFLARNGFYDGSPCHRLVTTGIHVLQCGDPTGSGSGSPGYSYGPLENVPADYRYPAGSVAMARGGSPDSHGSQFFIVYEDSVIGNQSSGGYTLVGKVVSGLKTVEKVAAGGDDGTSQAGGGAPRRPVSIKSVTVSPG